MLDREFYENFGALEKGVILPSCKVDEQLAAIPATEARVAKRKWRKLLRRARKQLGPWSDKAGYKRYARRELSNIGRKMMQEKNK